MLLEVFTESLNMSLNLSQKVAVVTAIPIFASFALAMVGVRENCQKKNQAEELLREIGYVKNISHLVHELQKERGKSVGYISGSVLQADLGTQILQTDIRIKEIHGDTAHTKELDALLGDIEGMRKKISLKELAIPEIVKNYTGFIQSLLKDELKVSRFEDSSGVARKLISLYTLEVAKENAGKLRASVTGILGADTAISDKQLSSLVIFLNAVESNLSSPVSNFSVPTLKSIQNFNDSDHWKEVKGILSTVIQKWNTGQFGTDPKLYFKTVSRSIDALAVIVEEESLAISNEVQSGAGKANQAMILLSGFLLLGMLSLGATVFFMIRSIITPIQSVISSLFLSAGKISSEANGLMSSSQKMSEGTATAAASIQETAASLDEISSMIKKNSENSVEVSRIAFEGEKSAESGKSAIQNMSKSIGEIQESHHSILSSIQNSHHHMSDIVGMIKNIGEKTKVINDIVFQTKLLSFNASVEAARAGVHGKGFAVVAEEVGKLAQMSGSAALEIRQMLENSVQKVESIVQESQKSVGLIIEEGEKKIQSGVATSSTCRDILDEIVERVSKISQSVGAISTASNEQAVGVEQVNIAINQLDKVTHENATMSAQSATTASILAEQSKVLHELVVGLTLTIKGKDSKADSKSMTVLDSESLSRENSRSRAA